MNRKARMNARKPLSVTLMMLALLTPAPGVSGEILGVSVETSERAARLAREPAAPMIQENRLDDMDVYALSPAAVHLRLPRMTPPELRPLAALAVPPFVTSLAAPFETSASMRVFPDWTEFIHKAARDFDVPPELIAAVIQAESAFQPRAVSVKGAQGLMQLMPATGEALGLIDPFDPEANIRAGTRYLKAQLSRFSTLEEALAAYNAGPGKVIQYGGVPPFAETQDFVRRVLAEVRNQETGIRNQ
ncbi:MAG: lytic transglycosylase domain-containing protein [Zoogloeaceae bacterium]|jgi:soluble lytic murein transglycosylase-like protein|nr:lytic transglycosylase domain-containing protein [Zoogloeaceae bacterium]